MTLSKLFEEKQFSVGAEEQNLIEFQSVSGQMHSGCASQINYQIVVQYASKNHEDGCSHGFGGKVIYYSSIVHHPLNTSNWHIASLG